MQNDFSISRRRRRRERNGVAAAEFAVCLPLMVILLLGTLEASTMIFLKQTLSVAAYEGARSALVPGRTSAEVASTCQSILDDRKVVGGRVTVSPSPLEAQPVQTWVTVTVSAPADRNRVVHWLFPTDQTVSAQASMMKEYER